MAVNVDMGGAVFPVKQCAKLIVPFTVAPHGPNRTVLPNPANQIMIFVRYGQNLLAVFAQ